MFISWVLFNCKRLATIYGLITQPFLMILLHFLGSQVFIGELALYEGAGFVRRAALFKLIMGVPFLHLFHQCLNRSVHLLTVQSYRPVALNVHGERRPNVFLSFASIAPLIILSRPCHGCSFLSFPGTVRSRSLIVADFSSLATGWVALPGYFHVVIFIRL